MAQLSPRRGRPRVSLLLALSATLVLAALGGSPAAAEAITAKKLANKVLKMDPRRPADINLFTSTYPNGAQGLYPQGSAMRPRSGPLPSEAQVRKQLKAFLNRELGSRARARRALRAFDDPGLKDVIAAPSLRAAFIGMEATLFRPLVNYGLESGDFDLVRWGALPDRSVVAAATGPNGSRTVTFNRVYEREDFRFLIPTMGHEYLHHETRNSGSEEAINAALGGMAYLQLVSRDPKLAHTGTELCRFRNTEALVFLNTRERRSPDSEIFAPSGSGFAPGSSSGSPDLWMAWTTFYRNTGASPAPRTLSQILASLGLPRATEFSERTAKSFKDLNDRWMSDVGRLQASVLLRLVTVKQIQKKSGGLSRRQVVRKLKLKPYLAAIR